MSEDSPVSYFAVDEMRGAGMKPGTKCLPSQSEQFEAMAMISDCAKVIPGSPLSDASLDQNQAVP